MRYHEIDYEIIGNDMQYIDIEFDPNETVIAEAGVRALGNLIAGK